MSDYAAPRANELNVTFSKRLHRCVCKCGRISIFINQKTDNCHLCKKERVEKEKGTAYRNKLDYWLDRKECLENNDIDEW